MTDPLAAALAANNLSPESFQSSGGDETVLNGAVPYQGILDLWVKLVKSFQETGYYPVIRGAAEDHLPDALDHDPAAILAAAPAGNVREVLMPRLRERVESFEAFVDELPEKYQAELRAAMKMDPPDFDALAAAVDQSGMHCFGGKSALPSWPAEPKPRPRLKFHTTSECKGKPIAMTLVRLKKSYELPAYLNFGGWNDCPEPALQVAVLREWREKYNAIPICMTGDVLEFMLSKPPQTQEQAMQLAAEQWIFCDDIVGQGTQSVQSLAISLWQSKTWFFWWD
jgi:hypothetical protein